MDVRISCPICGQTEVGTLPEHLQSHSKQSLIDILLVQHQQIRRQLSPPGVHVISRAEISPERNIRSVSCLETIEPTQLCPEIPAFNHSNHGTNITGSIGDIKPDLPNIRCSSHQKASINSQLRFGLGNESTTHASVNTALNHKSKSHKGDKHSTKEGKSNTRHGHPTFVLVDHGSSKPGPSKRRASEDRLTDHVKPNNANEVQSQPATSIIQYIIDEVG